MNPLWKTGAFWLSLGAGVLVYVLGYLQSHLGELGLPTGIGAFLVPILGFVLQWINSHKSLMYNPTPAITDVKGAVDQLRKP